MENLIEKVIGPVIPLPTPFTSDEKIDTGAMTAYVQFLLDNGIRNVMTTVGTSRYNLLDNEEIKKVNAAVAKAAHGRAVSIVANPPFGGTKNAIEFAKHSADIGAEFLLLYYPERYYGEENTIKFFESVSSAANIKILIHEMPMRSGLGGPQTQYSLEVLDRLLQIENIVGFKEEALDRKHSDKILRSFKNRAIIIGAGGGMSRYLNHDFDLGARSFLGGVGGFLPKIELEFFESLISGNRARAKEIVETKEKPYFDAVVPIGWHPTLKAALSIKGLMPSFERRPMKILNRSELDQVSSALSRNGWL